MNFQGIIIGLGAFLIIGLLHPVVIKVEYHFGKKAWPVFLVLGILCNVLSLFAQNIVATVLLAVLGFSLFWSIGELFHQEKRVERGWFPRNPKKTETGNGVRVEEQLPKDKEMAEGD